MPSRVSFFLINLVFNLKYKRRYVIDVFLHVS